ncbi:PIN domain-containing protein [Candidatus Woesearchaeota archaeon]|nr:PIN domain-containing protein [Candidatus Woesearchaeota archaeon]
MVKYYFDACIWLDLLEDRNESLLPRGDYAWNLFKKILKEEGIIIYSDMIIEELTQGYGYPFYKIEPLFQMFKRILCHIDTTDEYVRKAKDLSSKRNIPYGDALHAILARKHQAEFITRDHDFEKITDIIIAKKPEDIT